MIPPPPPLPPPPKDTDGDGIIDENDKCPTLPGVIKYQGCPVPDTDKDGIMMKMINALQLPELPGIKVVLCLIQIKMV